MPINEYPQPPSKKRRVVFAIGILLFIGILLALGVPHLNKRSNVSNLNEESDSFFTAQSASTIGKITKMSDNNITIENSKGQVRQFKFFINLTVLDPNSATGENEAPKKKPEIGRLGTINFQFIDGEYQITDISYAPIGNFSPQPAASPNLDYERNRAKFPPPSSATDSANRTPPPLP